MLLCFFLSFRLPNLIQQKERRWRGRWRCPPIRRAPIIQTLDGRSEAPPVRYLDNKIVRVHRRVVLRASRGGQCDGARYAAAPEGVWRVQDVSEEMRLRRADRREVLPLCPNWTPL